MYCPPISIAPVEVRVAYVFRISQSLVLKSQIITLEAMVVMLTGALV